MTPTNPSGGTSPGTDVPGSFFSPHQWKAYVVSGPTREERKRRLALCPEEWRDEVKRHAQTVFAIKKFNKRKAREAKENEQSKRAGSRRAKSTQHHTD